MHKRQIAKPIFQFLLALTLSSCWSKRPVSSAEELYQHVSKLDVKIGDTIARGKCPNGFKSGPIDDPDPTDAHGVVTHWRCTEGKLNGAQIDLEMNMLNFENLMGRIELGLPIGKWEEIASKLMTSNGKLLSIGVALAWPVSHCSEETVLSYIPSKEGYEAYQIQDLVGVRKVGGGQDSGIATLNPDILVDLIYCSKNAKNLRTVFFDSKLHQLTTGPLAK